MSVRSSLLRRACLAVSAALAAPPAWADTSGVERTFLERAAISAADASCNLFSDGERLALKSGLYQAEGELLRAGYAKRRINALADEVGAHARSLGCEHPSVGEVAATIRSSYRQFAMTNWMEYPGRHGVWGASRSRHDAWAISRTDPATGLVFGLRRSASTPDHRFAVAAPVVGLPPATAKLILRDPSRLSTPWLGSLDGDSAELSPAPRSVSRPVWAGELVAETSVTRDALRVFYFPVAALDLLEALDPREAVVIEFTPSPRAPDQTPARIAFEIGDFRAARAFVMIPPPEYPAPEAVSGAH